MTFFTFSFILKSKHFFIISTVLDSTHKLKEIDQAAQSGKTEAK